MSVRHGRVARDKQLWKGTEIVGTKLYRNTKTYRTRGRILMADLGDITEEEFGWMVSRVESAEVRNNCGDIFHRIVRDREEEAGTGEEIVHLKKLGMRGEDLGEVDDGHLAGAVAGIEQVDLSSTRLTATQVTRLLRNGGSCW